MSGARSAGIVVAVDGGGSKTDAAVLDLASGVVLGSARGGGCSHHQLGIPAAVAVVDATVREALAAAGAAASDVVHAGCYLTAIDTPDEQQAVHAALAALPWGAVSVVVDNDVFALLRTGTDSPDAAVVICGTGINGVGVRADGATSRVLALGDFSGDWGGSSGLAEQVLWYAARAEDGRGEPTVLRDALLRWTGRASVHDVALAVHAGELTIASWWDRTPEVFALAHEGDAVAQALVARQGEEIGVLAASLLARLDLDGAEVPVVVGGGIGGTDDPILVAGIERALALRAPKSSLVIVSERPLTGAAHLALTHARAR